MKKIIMVTSIFLLAAIGLLHSAGIIVHTPNAGTVWTAGSGGTITWMCSTDKSMDLKINIFRNSIAQSNFVAQLKSKNTGKKVWSIPAGFQAGKYILRIKTIDNKLTGDSSVFTIKSKSLKPSSGNTIIRENLDNPVHQIQQNQFRLKNQPKSVMVLQDMLKPDLVVKEIIVITEQPVRSDVSEILINVVVQNIGSKDIVKMSDWFAVDIRNKSGWGGPSMNYGGGVKAGDVKVFSGIKIHLHRDLPGFKPEYTVILDMQNKLIETSETNNSKDFSVKLK